MGRSKHSGPASTILEVAKAATRYGKKKIAESKKKKDKPKEKEWKVPESAYARKIREGNIRKREIIKKETGF